jgi:thiol-disulfide isomerase/thioredoxin
MATRIKQTVLLLSIITVISCHEEKINITHSNIIIAGKVRNHDLDNPYITVGVNRISFEQEQISSKINSTGYFKIEFDSKIPTDIWLKYKTNFLILTHPGDSIFVEFDGSKDNRYELLKSVKFKGDFAIENFKAAKFQQKYFFLGYYTTKGIINEFAEKYDPLKFRQLRDSIRIIELSNLKKFIKKYNPSSETANWARILLNVDYYRDLASYSDHHQLGNKPGGVSQMIPNSYYDFLKNPFTLNDSVLISGYSISKFVNIYPPYLLEQTKYKNKSLFESPETIKKSHLKIDSLILFSVINEINDPLLRQMVLTEILRQRLEQSQINMFNQHEKIISDIVLEPYLKELLFELYRQMSKNLEISEGPNSLINQYPTDRSIKPEIDKIIVSNKGKIIYIDCWATWCGPCIAEIPQSKRLMEEYKSKEVAFIYVCLDSEKSNWEAIVSKNLVQGQHIYLDKTQSQEFKETFKINGIPHYILYDRKGNILENGTESPSFIKDKLDKLLAE